ncbi:uncharacterized protein LOC118409421 [Branchiostoma floridae]|uniref:Uncharacterized protein LOC118409421 n=2 Tax=Branchiostoma floridae TaxID=7739 RepID=A0A9J7HXP2_BRAFL|nr:uncharacterized protein LOC118409421 [Branchiostoma floridae]
MGENVKDVSHWVSLLGKEQKTSHVCGRKLNTRLDVTRDGSPAESQNKALLYDASVAVENRRPAVWEVTPEQDKVGHSLGYRSSPCTQQIKGYRLDMESASSVTRPTGTLSDTSAESEETTKHAFVHQTTGRLGSRVINVPPPRKLSAGSVDWLEDLTSSLKKENGTSLETGSVPSQPKNTSDQKSITKTPHVNCHVATAGESKRTLEEAMDAKQQGEPTNVTQDVPEVILAFTEFKERGARLEKNLRWLRQEIVDLKEQDQSLMRQFLDLRSSIHQLIEASLKVPKDSSSLLSLSSQPDLRESCLSLDEAYGSSSPVWPNLSNEEDYLPPYRPRSATGPSALGWTPPMSRLRISTEDSVERESFF